MKGQSIWTRIEAFLRRLLEGALEPADHPLVVRSKLLEAAEDLVVARLRAGLPLRGAVLRAEVYAPSDPDRWHQALSQDPGLAAALHRRLRDAGHPDAQALAVDLHVRSDVLPHEDDLLRRGFRLGWADPPALPQAPRGPARLVVEKGAATASTFLLEGPGPWYVGRLAEVVDEEGRLVRRNAVAFDDAADAVADTVSRVHAEVQFDPSSNAYLLKDNGSRFGTSIYRQGGSGLTRVGLRSVQLMPGDLLYFGQACLRFEREAAEGPDAGSGADRTTGDTGSSFSY